jgi:voltage-gated potassium channel
VPTLQHIRYQRIRRELQTGFLALVGVIVMGTVGYQVLEGWNALDALYMTIITLASVGYGETNPLSPVGRIFTIFLILSGLLTLAFILNRFTDAIVQGYFQERILYQRQQRVLDKLSDHFIVCGYGRMGHQVVREVATEQIPFVVIDPDTEVIQTARELGYLAITGDATLDEVLQAAGVERARCLITAMPSDADNLYTILSAKTLNPKIRAIARASTEEAITKLRRGGADAVVSPYITGGHRMAAAAIRPQVIDFLDGIITASERSFHMEELLLEPGGCPCIGHTIAESDLRGRSGALILAIRRADGSLIAGPTADVRLEAGDLLICLGSKEQVEKLQSILQATSLI